jgi:hypothetical protein
MSTDRNISFFRAPITTTEPLMEKTIQGVKDIVTTQYEDVTSRLRSADPKSQAEIKKKELDFVTFSGRFEKRASSGLIKYSGFICLDLDHIHNSEETKLQLAKDDKLNAVFIYTSPRGNGLKVIVSSGHGEDKHLACFNALCEYLRNTYNITVDPSGKDVSRACFLCYDPNAVYNPGSNIDESILKPQIKEIDTAIKMILDSQEGEKHNTLLRASHLLGGILGDKLSESQAQKILEDTIIKRGDVDDFSSAQKTIENGLREGKTKPLPPTEIKTIRKSFSDLIEKYRGQNHEYYINPLLYKGGVNILGAERGTGKTTYGISMGFVLSREIPLFLGHEVEAWGSVLYLNYELHEREFMIRARQIGDYFQDYEQKHALDFISIPDNISITMKEIQREVGSGKYDVIIIDSYKACMSKILAENNQKELNNMTTLSFYNMVNSWRQDHHATILLLNHTNKGTAKEKSHSDLMFGHSSLADYADSTSLMRKTQEPEIRLLIPDKTRFSPEGDGSKKLIEIVSNQDHSLMWLEVREDNVREEDYMNGEDRNRQAIKEEARSMRREGKSFEAIRSALNISKSTAFAYAKDITPPMHPKRTNDD